METEAAKYSREEVIELFGSDSDLEAEAGPTTDVLDSADIEPKAEEASPLPTGDVEEDEEIDVIPFEWEGKQYLRDDQDRLYDDESCDPHPVGRWDAEKQEVVAFSSD